MRTSPVIPAIVAAATIALVHGCALPLAGLSPPGAGGDASTSAISAGGATTTAAGTTSGGGAATSATTTSAAVSSSSTGVVECAMKADCPPDGKCTAYACTAGSCVQTVTNEGKPIDDASGNCEKTVCVNGTLTIQNDDSDFSEDGNQCTVDGCSNGSPTHVPGYESNPCGMPGHLCVDGQCVECAVGAQCPAGIPTCQKPVCNSGVCGFAAAMEGADCAPASGCHDASTCSNGACVQHNALNGQSCTNVIGGTCAGGGCCVFVTCGDTGDVCCNFGQLCNGSKKCKP